MMMIATPPRPSNLPTWTTVALVLKLNLVVGERFLLSMLPRLNVACCELMLPWKKSENNSWGSFGRTTAQPSGTALLESR